MLTFNLKGFLFFLFFIFLFKGRAVTFPMSQIRGHGHQQLQQTSAQPGHFPQGLADQSTATMKRSTAQIRWHLTYALGPLTLSPLCMHLVNSHGVLHCNSGTYMIQVNQGRIPSVKFPVPRISWHMVLLRFPWKKKNPHGQITGNLFTPHPLFATFAELKSRALFKHFKVPGFQRVRILSFCLVVDESPSTDLVGDGRCEQRKWQGLQRGRDAHGVLELWRLWEQLMTEDRKHRGLYIQRGLWRQGGALAPEKLWFGTGYPSRGLDSGKGI